MLEPHPEAQIVFATEAEQQRLLALDDGSPNDHSESPSSSEHGPSAERITLRIFAAMLSFLVLGIHTAAIGVLIPYMESSWHITDSQISLLFLTPLSGYLVASVSNSTVHAHFGRRGIAFIGSTCQLLVTAVVALHPPYNVFLIAFAVAGFGIGLIDAGWCAWAGGLRNANVVSGFLHGSYSAGATIGPYLTASLIAGVGWPWWSFYWIMTMVAVIEVIVLTYAFRHDTGPSYRAEKAQAHDPIPQGPKTKAIWQHRVIWICFGYLIAYVGAESIIANWVPTFLLRIRHTTTLLASICASCFWAGMALGRIILGSLTDKIGERLSVTLYLFAALAAQALFFLLPAVTISILSITLLGFFLGPIFPTGIVMVTRLMPRELHVGAVASVAAVGQVGGAVFPFVVGVMAERLGIQALQPVVFGLLVAALGAWWCFPRLPSRRDGFLHEHIDGEAGRDQES